MKISIERKTGQVIASEDVRVHSARLTIQGQVERLHSSAQTTWHPSLDEVEGYLASLPCESFVTGVTALEGRFLVLWQDQFNLYICCDRYGLHPIYYRLTPASLELFDRILNGSYPLFIPRDNALAFLLLRFMPGRHTLFDGIDQLMPGDCLLLKTMTGEVAIESVCVYPSKSIGEVDEEGASHTFHALFREGLEKRIQAYNHGEKLLLPLSGGLDSRYLLGTALELVAPSRIVSMTFGTPGSYDYEIGRQVAEAAGVRHVAYPLSPDNYSAEAFQNNCRDTDGQISFTTEAPVETYQDFAQYGSVVLSGYVGDTVMGKKVHPHMVIDRRSIVLDDVIIKSDDPLTGYLASQIVEDSYYYENWEAPSLTAPELWFFINHFTKYSIYCVCKYREHFKYVSPFIDYAFLDYVLNLPSEFRNSRRLYFSWLERHFPGLSALPCSSFRGAPLSASPHLKWLAHQWDRLNHYGFGINRTINKIDLPRFYEQLLEPDQLQSGFASVFPSEFMQRMFGSRRYYFLLYNLKCLEILRLNFGAEIG